MAQLVDRITAGPGTKDLIKAMLSLVAKTPPRRVPVFGNGYREFPILITSVRVHTLTENNLVVDLEGELDYRNLPGFPQIPGVSKVQGKKVRIIHYDAHRRVAESNLLID